MKNKVSFILGFLSGCTLGAVLMLGSGVVAEVRESLKNFLAFKLGEYLDIDFLYLKTGNFLRGRVIAEDDDSLLFEVPKGTVKFSKADIERIDYNFYTRYLEKSW